MDDLATGRRFTYAEFDQRVGRLAAGLRKRFGVARAATAWQCSRTIRPISLRFSSHALGSGLCSRR
jgi:acyl-CoA synthetase (AMP-forming)/AMP-acid ligase II